MTSTQVDITARLAELAHTHDQLTTALATVTERLDQVKEEIRTITGGDGAHLLPDGHKITVTPTRRFNETRAREVLSPDLVAAITEVKSTVSAMLAKRVLSGADYEACQTVAGKPRVTISVENGGE
ncbi:hypothetical protein ACOCHS_06440 [Propionibacteriaceae bacterium Y2011]